VTFDTEVIVSTIGAVATVGTSILTYIITKKKEREADLRQNMMKRYDDLVGSLTELVQSRANASSGKKFIDAYYKAGAYASKDVLNACYELLQHLKKKGTITTIAEIASLVDGIYNAVRKDTLGPEDPGHPFEAYHLVDDIFKS
jgi:hypothetical protein